LGNGNSVGGMVQWMPLSSVSNGENMHREIEAPAERIAVASLT
jgi:hypothetical protein